jgi:hypothetical protein
VTPPTYAAQQLSLLTSRLNVWAASLNPSANVRYGAQVLAAIDAIAVVDQVARVLAQGVASISDADLGHQVLKERLADLLVLDGLAEFDLASPRSWPT